MAEPVRWSAGAMSRNRSASRRGFALLAALLCTTLAALAMHPMSADAYVGYDYCTGSISGGGHCDGSYVNLYESDAFDDYGSNRVCAGGVYSGSFYGSYACGYGYAGQCYGLSGPKPMAPRAHNGESYAQQMHGHAYEGFCP